MRNMSVTETIFGNKSTLDYLLFARAHWLKTVSCLYFVFLENFCPGEASQWYKTNYIKGIFSISCNSGIKHSSEINQTQEVCLLIRSPDEGVWLI